MTSETAPMTIGIDVAKDELVVACDQVESVVTIANNTETINDWLATLPSGSFLAVEATNTYHLNLIHQAHACGHTVYLVDGFRLKNYRSSVNQRAKTDKTDAQLLLRFLRHEHEDLNPWEPPQGAYYGLQGLMRRRATLVKARSQLRQSLAGIAELQDTWNALLKHLDAVERQIKAVIQRAIREAGWHEQQQTIKGLEGFGEVVSTGVTTAYHRGQFRSSDAFIAFIGLDVKVSDSGKTSGKRKLTKKGDPELRRLLHMAAMTARRTSTWSAFYQRQLERGRATTEALVILARKLARIAFSLLKNGTTYVPKTPSGACNAT